mmetsp:Transcript_42076/g.105077  ORF Transcript_42076/g.105077 Transcript_42076/m.105077 type:complete len:220 (+) Transcript_42076:3550-4209(+)
MVSGAQVHTADREVKLCVFVSTLGQWNGHLLHCWLCESDGAAGWERVARIGRCGIIGRLPAPLLVLLVLLCGRLDHTWWRHRCVFAEVETVLSQHCCPTSVLFAGGDDLYDGLLGHVLVLLVLVLVLVLGLLPATLLATPEQRRHQHEPLLHAARARLLAERRLLPRGRPLRASDPLDAYVLVLIGLELNAMQRQLKPVFLPLFANVAGRTENARHCGR